ncbi:fungal-specific transcription factor domain-containing protein [Nemania sp. FL0916]|nr:fungal-specific transcription factor domain-containing protein [Nemania sp. FL0916]
MSLRPLRPSQSTRRADDYNEDGEEAGRDGPPGGGRQGPLSKPTVLPRTKRATCSQCRVRKVRCDGREGACHNCERLGFECSFQQSPSKSPVRYALIPPERRRRMQACIPCHTNKTRCHGETPRCSNCVRKGRECTYPASRRPDAAAAAASSPSLLDNSEPSASTSILGQDTLIGVSSEKLTLSTAEKTPGAFLPDPATVVELIEDYFDHLYPLPSFAFLHKPTVTRRCQDGTIHEALKLAICAITSLHLQRTSLSHHLWAQQAEHLVMQQISRPSIFNLQALLLVVRYHIESGEFPTAFMLAALAARTAVALRLNYERSELAFVAQEARRRLFWALYLLDDYFCVGLREFELCPEETIYLQLPCREAIFEAGQACQTGLLQPSASDNAAALGLRGNFLRLTSARRAVMRFNRRVGLDEESPSTIGGRIRQFEQDLAGLQAALSPEHQFSDSNLATSDWPAQLVMLHMSYHQCHCDIYRMFLNGYSEAAPSKLLASISSQDQMTMQAQCLAHAESILRILRAFMAQHGDDDNNTTNNNMSINNDDDNNNKKNGKKNTKTTNNGSARLLFLERDAAVCAFESARLVLFGARLSSTNSSSNLAEATRKAKDISLRFIAQFFPYSASTRALRTALENLIASYTARQAQQQSQSQSSLQPQPQTQVQNQVQSQSQTQLQTQSPIQTSSQIFPPVEPNTGKISPEPLGPAAPRPSSRISQFANSRQRLSVQSLLLQSDFSDDSHEIAGPGPVVASSGIMIQSSSNSGGLQMQLQAGGSPYAPSAFTSSQRVVGEMPGIDMILGDASDVPMPTMPVPLPHPMALPAPHPLSHPLSHSLTHPLPLPVPLQSQPQPQPQPQGQMHPSRSYTSSPWGATIDARREDAGLIFNPWMGFTGPEELYGYGNPEGMSEEY